MLVSTLTSSVTSSTWFNGLNANPGSLMRLFCFPYAGGGSLIYRQWPKQLPPTIEVVRAQLPGREGRLKERPFTRVESLITELTEAIEPFLDKPFIFFGHSMGGLISFELTRRVQKEFGLLPAHLFISAYKAPHLPDTLTGIYTLPEPEFIEEVRRLNGTPNDVLEHRELMRLVLPLIRSDFELCNTYRYVPGPPLYCPLTIFGGLEDEEAGKKELEGWRQHTTGPFMLHMLPGDHFFIDKSRHVLLRLISRYLEITCRKAVQL